MNRFVLLFVAVLLCVYAAQAIHVHQPVFLSFNDSIPPAINCPPNDTVQLGPDLCSVAYTYLVVGYDDQPGFVLTQTAGLPSGAEFPIGTTVNQWLVTDSGGNTDTCSFTVLVRNFPISLMCRDSGLVFLQATCNETVLPSELLEGGPYGCVDSFMVQVDRMLPIGNGPWMSGVVNAMDIDRTMGFRVTDPFTGNSCWGRLIVRDTVRPTLVCTPLTVACAVDSFSLGYLRDTLGLSGVTPVISDNCTPMPVIVFSDIFQNYPCSDTSTVSGVVLRTWTAVDGSGRNASCVQVITRQRLLADVQLPADITLSCEDSLAPPPVAGEPFVMAGNQVVSIFDDTACEFDAFHKDSVEMLCGGSRRILRSWQVFDACLPIAAGNPKTGLQIIHLLDTLGPEIACPPSLTIQSPAFTCSGAVLLPDLEIIDDCSPITGYAVQWEALDSSYTLQGDLLNWPGNDPFFLDTLGRLDSLPEVAVGNTVLLFSATDACGNIGLCSTVLSLWDMAAPAAVCNNQLTVTLSQEGTATLAAVEMDAGSMDACGDLSFRARRLPPACLPDSLWRDTVQFCCADWGDTVAVMLRVYDIEMPVGPVNSAFGAGQYSDCTVMVVVQGDSTLSCTAPPDTVVDCLSFDVTLATYGQPMLSCSADSMAIHIDNSEFNNACRSGILLRRFSVFNTTGDSAHCEQQIVSAQLQRFFVRFPDDVIATVCNPAGEYGEPEVMEEYCGQISAAFTDEVFEIVPDACYKIERTWTVVNTCSVTPGATLIDIPNPSPEPSENHPSNLPGPVVSPFNLPGNTWQASFVALGPGQQPTDFSTFWQADAVGYRYKQIIKVIDTQPPVAASCPPAAVVFTDSVPNIPTLWNDTFVPTVGPVDLCESAANVRIDFTDACSGADLQMKFYLQLDLDGDGVRETVVRSDQITLGGQIPTNNAGNPNFSGGDLRTFDNRPVPVDQKYRFVVRTLTNGAIRTAQIAWNTSTNPSQFLVPKLPLGTHAVTWYAVDRCGNEKSCHYQFTVEKANAACTELVGAVNGVLETEVQAGVQFAQIRLVAASPNLPPIDMTVESNMSGNYAHSPVLAAGADYEVIPKRSDNPTNGVTTFDLVLISRHILGQDTLDSPYRMIAADANRSGSVTSFDIVEFRRLILGIHDTLPNNTSWRFIDKNYVFPNPFNPFQEPFPEKVVVNDLSPQGITKHDFIGLKVGDLNGSASPNGLHLPDDRQVQVLPFFMPNRLLHAGEETSIKITAPEPLLGFQFTLEFPGLEILDIEPGPEMAEEHFALFENRSAATVSWHNPTDIQAPSFSVRVKAKKQGFLSDLLEMSSAITVAEAYTSGAFLKRPDFVFQGGPVQKKGLTVYPPEPNPFKDICRLRCLVSAEEKVTIRVCDAAGREVLAQEKWLPEGEQVITLDLSGVNASGVLQVLIQSPGFFQTYRVLRYF